MQCTYLEQAVHHLQSTGIVVAMDKGRSPRGNEVSFFASCGASFFVPGSRGMSQRPASPDSFASRRARQDLTAA